MKTLFLGIFAITLLGVGGLMYRNALEYPTRVGVCPLDAKLCPDGTSVTRTGVSCTFAECAPPNVTLTHIGVSFVVPRGFTSTTSVDAASVAAYEVSTEGMSISPASILIRSYPIAASSTALKTIQETAVEGASGLQAPVTAYTSKVLGNHRFTVVSLERFEGVITTAYYMARQADVLRFDALDRDTTTLPAHKALVSMLETLQAE